MKPWQYPNLSEEWLYSSAANYGGKLALMEFDFVN
jgi:hypothetical protein